MKICTSGCENLYCIRIFKLFRIETIAYERGLDLILIVMCAVFSSAGVQVANAFFIL